MLLSGLNITLVILLLRKCKYFVPLKCRSPHGVSPLIMLSSLPCMALLGPCGKIWPFVASCGLCDIMRLFVALHCIAWLLYFLNWLAMQLRYSLNISTYRDNTDIESPISIWFALWSRWANVSSDFPLDLEIHLDLTKFFAALFALRLISLHNLGTKRT